MPGAGLAELLARINAILRRTRLKAAASRVMKKSFSWNVDVLKAASQEGLGLIQIATSCKKCREVIIGLRQLRKITHQRLVCLDCLF